MNRASKAKPRRRRKAAPHDELRVNFIERPDGVYWQSRDGGKEYGPFATLADAEADALTVEVTEYGPGESVEEAEAEIGIAEWVDPDTGAPAEESVPRIEDH
ncbi:MAG: hypothetical protein EPO27_18940 [Betaproteobacteria bacterium]|nr:MAG: hypothetical protein EPO27_18940 [Betaproteobacteria bacterium]